MSGRAIFGRRIFEILIELDVVNAFRGAFATRQPALARADVKKLNEVDEKVVDEIVEHIGIFNGWSGDGSSDARRELLNKVADGEVSVEQALASFR
jgi:hypothetical protein